MRTMICKENLSASEINCIKVASEVERMMLPKRPIQIDNVEVAGWTIYTGILGGDFFDYHNFQGVCCPSTNNIRIVVGDAAGHGVCSALLMFSLRSYLRSRAMQKGNLSQVMTDVNKLMCMDVQSSGHFATAFYASIFGIERKIDWVYAGQDPALFYAPNTDEFFPLEGKGLALGVDPEADYCIYSRSGLPKGAIILIGSDGFWEMERGTTQMSCKGMIKELVRSHRNDTALSIAEAAKMHVLKFGKSYAAKDDITLVVVKFKDDV